MNIEAILTGILSNVEFEVCDDTAAFNYEDKRIYLDAVVYFDGSEDEIFDYTFDGEPAELSETEKEMIIDTLCEVHKQFIEAQEEERKAAEYNAWADNDTESFINANFHSIY